MAYGGLAERPTSADPRFLDDQVGPVQLADVASGRAFVLRFPGPEPEPAFGLTVYRYTNANRSEVLELFCHPGCERYEFMEFRVGAPADAKGAPATSLASFQSGRGVHLGLTVEQLIQLLGKPHGEKSEAGARILLYHCSSSTACPVLGRVGMPAYAARYSFRSGVLVAFESGYPYP
jgi:hypothetical protein